MLSVVNSMALQGLDGVLIKIEVDISSGLPAWDIIGLPDTSVKESKERVRIAIKNYGIDLLSRKYVINLSPADIKKIGSTYDLAIAVGILYSIGEINENSKLDSMVFLGELSLDGKIKAINGVLPMCIEAFKFGMKKAIVPKDNEKEASCVEGLEIIGVSTLEEVIDYLNGKRLINPTRFDDYDFIKNEQIYSIDFDEVKGQRAAKRALEIAVAGNHNILMIGSPGSR